MPTDESPLEIKVEEVRKDVRRILDHIEGPQGFHVRIDRLEQNHERHKWLTRTSFGAALVALLGVVAKWIGFASPSAH